MNFLLNLFYISVPSIDMSDVKVYVELASISAGENDTEIDQVACFHDAVMGYAPLLYSLSPQAGFREFMKRARHVWDTQSRDEKLPDKLVIYISIICRQHLKALCRGNVTTMLHVLFFRESLHDY